MSRLKILLFVLCITGIYSCSDQDDAIQNLNEPPVINIDKDKKMLTDSLRYYTGENYFYNFKINMSDINNNIWKCTYKTENGNFKVFYNGNELLLPSLRVDQKELNISVSPQEPGLNVIKFIAEDKFGKTDEAQLSLFLFDNLPPVASLEYVQLSSLEYQFDGSSSFDQDKNFGGLVAGYYFEIGGIVYETPSPVIKHIFNNPGLYSIKLKVIDNNGSYSPVIEKKVTIN
ncbi:MAG: hypothetical protein WBP45_14885 [Daejeonella sp.]